MLLRPNARAATATPTTGHAGIAVSEMMPKEVSPMPTSSHRERRRMRCSQRVGETFATAAARRFSVPKSGPKAGPVAVLAGVPVEGAVGVLFGLSVGVITGISNDTGAKRCGSDRWKRLYSRP